MNSIRRAKYIFFTSPNLESLIEQQQNKKDTLERQKNKKIQI
jgi:hypothetical protein